jgi:hypothetical protein
MPNRTTLTAALVALSGPIIVILALACTPLPTSAATAKNKIAHVMLDDGSKNDSFEKFRTELLLKLASHDRQYIEGILSPDIGLSIGGEKGKSAFMQKWSDLGNNSQIWNRLERVLLHGAQFDAEASEYHAPSVSFEDSHSELPQAVVWNKNASLRKAPDAAAPALQSPYNEQITILQPAEHEPVVVDWLKVKSANGAVGYIKASDVYSAFDEFAVFKLRQGKWCMTWFGFAELP